MRYFPLIIAVSALFAAAQEPTPVSQSAATPSDSTQCASQQVVDNCVAIMKKALEKCSSDNWDCKCSGSANIANCYVNCPDSPDYIAAQSSSASDCATANAYDKGHTVVPDTWKTMDFYNNVRVTATSTNNEASPTSTGAKILDTHKESAKPSKGAANVKATGSWLALVGLGIGAFF
ncbi:uncharacterized protein N7496_005397 [Penicillium cataractarum]|uniref:Extracellular membrane protein CFEM domain-containing protein n=1 Tax=Penicillium cataractarum TaxID=2100454 RepID=A0A9W9SG51_9EURO|nr:uncharacterized protein N7496_005397 [Penicillium cataractarum]KAJ5377988.1 hypothetical protein N7496_005397 [Penicillium cataractarum]